MGSPSLGAIVRIVGPLRRIHAAESAETLSRVPGARSARPAARQPGFTCPLLIKAIAVAMSDDTSVMLPGTIIVLLVLASDW